MALKNHIHQNRITTQTFVLILLLAWTSNASGEPPPISTDRILQGNSPDILQPGYFQIETGYYSYENPMKTQFIKFTSNRILQLVEVIKKLYL